MLVVIFSAFVLTANHNFQTDEFRVSRLFRWRFISGIRLGQMICPIAIHVLCASAAYSSYEIGALRSVSSSGLCIHRGLWLLTNGDG